MVLEHGHVLILQEYLSGSGKEECMGATGVHTAWQNPSTWSYYTECLSTGKAVNVSPHLPTHSLLSDCYYN